MRNYDLIIIGAGPAGLMAALSSSLPNILILEAEKSAGRKLLISGAGQCNLTHSGSIKEFIARYGDNGSKIRSALYTFSNLKLMSFFEQKGVPLVVRDDGKVFPKSGRSRDILHLLLQECRVKGVSIQTEHEVSSVVQKDAQFCCVARGKEYYCENLLIATGGKSYPDTGSRGQGYSFAESFGHRVVEPRPALAPFYIDDFAFADCAGISFNVAAISLIRSKKIVKNIKGAILLTHRGFSGPLVLHTSRYIQKGDILQIDFLADETEENTRLWMQHFQGKKRIESALAEKLPQKFAATICKAASIAKNETVSVLSKEKRAKLLELLHRYKLCSFHVAGFKEAMVTAGGISMDEVNTKTYESKLCKRLYFAGELLDIDGDTGGYNLQAAFSTGFAVGTALSK